MSSEAHLAWALADSMGESFSMNEKSLVYVALGAGETVLAIQHMLEIAAHNAQPLPAALVNMTARWVDAHTGNPHEPTLRRLLTNVESTATPPCPPEGR